MTARKAAGAESWDDFWAEVSGARTEIIRGVEVEVPRDLPFGFEERMAELKESTRAADFEEMVERLFGADIFGQWQAAGMGLREMVTVLTWGMAQASGQDMTFREAYEAVGAMEAQGKAPNRQARRAASKPPSGSTGGRSKRTSSGSTSSARARSAA